MSDPGSLRDLAGRNRRELRDYEQRLDQLHAASALALDGAADRIEHLTAGLREAMEWADLFDAEREPQRYLERHNQKVDRLRALLDEQETPT